jgi:hypothetical protein
LVLLATALSAALGAGADEVWLDNGRRLSGKVTRLPDGRVEVVAALGRLVLPGERVAKIERGESVEEAVQAALALLAPGDVTRRFELASLCQREGAATLARQLFQAVVRLSPDHEGARRALGYQRFGGSWLTEEQVHAARGEVKFRGEWVPLRERERVLAWETARALAAAEASRAEARAAELAQREARLAAAEEGARGAGPGLYRDPYCCGATYPVILWPHPVVPRPPRGPVKPPVPPRPRQRPVEHHRSGVSGPGR